MSDVESAAETTPEPVAAAGDGAEPGESPDRLERRARRPGGRRHGPFATELVLAAPDDGVREIAIAAATIVGLSRFLEGATIWTVVGLALVAIGLAALQVLGDTDPSGEALGVPIEAVLLPAAATAAAMGAIRIVPVGPLLIPAILLVGVLVARLSATEVRIFGASGGTSAADRQSVLLEALVVAFVGFAGVAALVPGGLPDPQAPPIGPLSVGGLAILAAGDAVVAGLVGYRVAALRVGGFRAAIWTALTFAAVAAIGALALRAVDLPRLLGPALLTLLFYLWDAIGGATPTRRRDPRWIWQTILLVLVAVVVIAWNQQLAG